MSKALQITAIKGMNDILPPESARWEWLEEVVRRVMAAHAYRNIRTPIMEHTQLFTRGLGEVTDVVEKEMYSFQDRADQHGHVDAVEDLGGIVADLDVDDVAERAVVELHDDALQRLQRGRDLQETQLDRPVAQQGTAGDTEQQAVADLACGAGDGDLGGSLSAHVDSSR